VLAWALIPAYRAVALVANPFRSPSGGPGDLAVEDVRFTASDGVKLAGWLARGDPDVAAIVLVPGFKADRREVLPWAQFLNRAGYSVLLLDRRACGDSDGWAIALGAREQADVIAAVTYLKHVLGDVHIGVLGVSLGAGIAIRAAAADPRIGAVVADSAWTDQDFQLDRLRGLRLGPFDLPLLPYAETLVDAIAGADVRATARPIDDIARLAPAQATFLIHSLDDANGTTPPSGEAALFTAAHEPKQEWRTSGGHIGAIAAHPDEYRERVLDFFARQLR
jgi:pimeloyl-ACP methyl ester carboxylesterase